MVKLNHYMQDGANYQARAVLAYLQGHAEIESSWDNEYKHYKATIYIARWENCREQGYIAYMCDENYESQINIAFFEHRNSDDICAVKWIQKPTINSLTIDTAEFGNFYKDKYDVSNLVQYGEASKMAAWIIDELTKFWNERSIKKSKT